MRPLIFATVVVLMLNCSCRSSRHDVLEYADSTSVSVDASRKALSHQDLMSTLCSSRNMLISGIRIEFFPPDSLHPEADPAPRSISVESVISDESAQLSSISCESAEDNTAVALSADSTHEIQHNENSNNEAFHPPDWIIFIVVFLAWGALIFYLKSK